MPQAYVRPGTTEHAMNGHYEIERLWRSAFCSYTKDHKSIEAWLELVERGPDEALKAASKFIEARVMPDAITLGFSPQVLIGALALREHLTVVTSPEVERGLGPASLSKRALDIYADRVELVIAPFAPSPQLGPEEVLRKLADALSNLRAKGIRVLDISGGTQLVPIAAIKAGFDELSYAYPDGEKLIFYGPIIPVRKDVSHEVRRVHPGESHS